MESGEAYISQRERITRRLIYFKKKRWIEGKWNAPIFTSFQKNSPNLSIYDLRMCAYLKIGLNSKEIADIFQVLPSSINVSRYRLRKKLNLSQEEDLYEFLNSLE